MEYINLEQNGHVDQQWSGTYYVRVLDAGYMRNLCFKLGTTHVCRMARLLRRSDEMGAGPPTYSRGSWKR